MSDGVKLSPRSVERLARLIRKDRFAGQPDDRSRNGDSWPDMFPAKISGLVGVSTMSGSDLQPGTGSAELYFMNDSSVLKKQEIPAVKVFHWTYRKFIVGEWVLVMQQPDGQYWIVGHSHKAMFLTPSGGIAARTGSSSPWTPGVATCERCEYYFDSGTRKIRTTGVSESVNNMVPAVIGGSKLIQVGLIDGAWTIDVDPC